MALGKLKLKKNESLLLTVSIIAVFAMYWTYWYGPRKIALRQIDDSIAAVENEIAMKNAQIATAPVAAPPPVAESQASRELVEKYRKSNGQLANVIASMAANDPAYPFLLKSMSTASQSFSGGFTQVAYEIELESNFVAVGKFLQRLEDSPLLTELHSIEIARTPNEMKRCETKLKLYSYALTGGETR